MAPPPGAPDRARFGWTVPSRSSLGPETDICCELIYDPFDGCRKMMGESRLSRCCFDLRPGGRFDGASCECRAPDAHSPSSMGVLAQVTTT